MDIAKQLIGQIQETVSDVVTWQESAQMCSREAHEFTNALVFGWLVILVFSVWLYRRINPSKPKKMTHAQNDGRQESLTPTTSPH